MKLKILLLILLLAGLLFAVVDCGGATANPKPNPISGEKALEHVRQLVGFGPRPAGSEKLRLTRDYIAAELNELGLSPSIDSFTDVNAPGVTFHNVSVEIRARRTGEPRVLVLGSHYDTKLFAGHDDPAYNFRFVGANDGGSSSGLLLELAAHFKQHPLDCNLLLVWFDGEECLNPEQWIDDQALFGSRRCVRKLRARFPKKDFDKLREAVPVMVLLDMVGARDLLITEDEDSSPRLIAIFRESAAELGYARHFFRTRTAVKDDHISFKNYEIEVIDLIHFGPPTPDWWHTERDTLDILSAESLGIVAHVVVEALPKIVAEFYP